MSARKIVTILATLVVVASLLIGCAPKATPTAPPPYRAKASTTPHPTDTPVPSTTTPQLPVLAGTPVPVPAGVISPSNAERMTQLARWGKGAIMQVAYSPDGRLLAAGSSLGIYLYDAGTLKEARFLETTSPVYSVAFSPDGSLLASGSADYTVRVWRVADGSLVRSLEGHTHRVESVAFSPDGSLLASGSMDGTVRLWGVAKE
ncbi:MAG: hypothetical protein QHH80_00745 [Anaerolineae bacterium]|nr:hypothetical protein [Anaerolineae bacterium]